MNKTELYQRLSVAISFGRITATDYIDVIQRYKYFIHDLFFSPVEDVRFQTRPRNYDFENTTRDERIEDLSKVISFARKNGIEIVITLNSPNISVSEAVSAFEFYHNLYNIQNVTTFASVAEILKNQYEELNIICSYNEGLTGISKLQKVLDMNIFSTIVFGSSMLHNFQAFKMAKEHGALTSIIANTGCMLDCHLFCRQSNLCKGQFERHLKSEGINCLYATTSIFPEEIYKYYLPSGFIDYIKLASRPIRKDELDKLLYAYTNGNTEQLLTQSEENYHLYARLGHFMPHYSEIELSEVMEEKSKMWDKLKYKF